MRKTIRAASLSVVLAAAVLAGGSAQAYAAEGQAAAAPATKAAAATGIWIWTGEFASRLEAEANYWVLYGLGAATQMLIEYSGHNSWVLYVQ
ncbi:hypothetical protein [Streptomyces sp. NPDC094032]|uniref:hypothetical protein n=1 Tax=Streptomyces sp. NPDC094032 TaxID=3155308 RepID=UPI00332DED37